MRIFIRTQFGLALVAALVSAVSVKAATGPGKSDYPVVGLIGEKYKQLGGSAGPLGHPTSNETSSKEGNGRYQTFQHGVIGSSPATGPKSVQALYAKEFEMVFEWGDTSPFNYDFFIVRWDLNGKNIGQQDIKGGSRTSGQWVTHPAAAGRYRLVVEGADGRIGSSSSKQGWSNALYLDFTPPPPIPTKYKQLGGSTGSLGRATSKELDSKEGKGRYQTFEHGVIGWSPSTGPNSVQAVYVKNQELVFEWGNTSPFNYDFFIVRWDLDGKNVGQQDVKGGSRTSGRWVTRPHAGGRYRLVVEGADGRVGGSTSKQGWSNPLYFDYAPPAPEYTSYRPAVKEPQPQSRPVPVMPQGLYLKEWMRLGGPDGPMGLPTGGVRPHPGGKGGVAPFENGQISFSPDVWEKGILAAYQEGDSIVVDWIVSWGEPHPPSHFNYDKFIVRCDLKGKNVGQVDINADGDYNKDIADTHLRTRGLFRFRPQNGPGDYSITVEGADTHGVLGSKARQGWMKPVSVHFAWPRGKDDPPLPEKHSALDLANVAAATSVADAKAKFDKRTAAAVLYNACQPLPHTDYKNEGNFGVQALARLAYADYFQADHMPGRDYRARDEVIEALRRQQIGSKAGTTNDEVITRTGEYDVALSMLVAIIYKYYHVLPPDVQNHIIDDLLNKRGPFDPSDKSPIPGIPETENHLMNIESARYLTNQLLYLRQGDPKYDNSRNGMDNWMLLHLQEFLKNDFIEYNARPYQDYTVTALLNLYSYTSPRHPSSLRVKKAAQMVLDYVMAKVAVSSNDSRRSVTYRRKSSYNTPHFINDHYDPQTAFSMALAGTTDMVSEPLPGSFAWEMQWAGLSDYRIPDAILDLMVERSHRVFFQRFHHAYADEAYASSPSYLINSGGHYAQFAYKFAGLAGKHDDIGLALPTTFMPTGQFKTRDDLIRFEGDKDDVKRSNMGVAPDFACGLNPIIPDAYQAAAVGVDDNGKRTPRNLKVVPWTFIDQSHHEGAHQAGRRIGGYATGPFRPGYYVAVYHRDGFGFLEAYDTALHPGLTFDDFMKKVLERNKATSFKITGRNSYVMTDGRKIEFEISPNSVVHLPAEKPFFVKGTILNGADKSGLITIDNPSTHKRITLDMRDWKAPKRTEN